jgi:hypothetical protein
MLFIPVSMLIKFIFEWIDFDSKIVQNSTSVKNMFDTIIFSQPAFIFNSSTFFIFTITCSTNTSTDDIFLYSTLCFSVRGFPFRPLQQRHKKGRIGKRKHGLRRLQANSSSKKDSVSFFSSFHSQILLYLCGRQQKNVRT